MTPKPNYLPIILSSLALVIIIPVLIWAISQRQEVRKEAAGNEAFPNIDLNNDGVVNNVDLRIYLEKYASPKP